MTTAPHPAGGRACHCLMLPVMCLLATACGKTNSASEPEKVQPVVRDDDIAVKPPETPAPAPTGDDATGRPTLDPSVQRVIEGTSCAGHGEQITDASSGSAFTREGAVWSRSEFWGCGCPRGPEFTLVYEPGTSPLVLRLCHDDAQDPCEAGCQQTLAWNLDRALADAEASEVTFAPQ